MPIIKICNVRQAVEIDALANQAIEIAGFRLLSGELESEPLREKASLIEYAKSRGMRVALTTTSTQLAQISNNLDPSKIDFLNLHYEPQEKQIALARKHFPNSKVSGLLSYEKIREIEKPELLDKVDYTIIDWSAGGTGLFPGVEIFKKFRSGELSDKAIIAGGLTAVNVGRLLEIAAPFALDLDSSVRDPVTRLIDESKVAKFARAVRNFSGGPGQRANRFDAPLPFARVNQWPWSRATDRMITDNDVVANSRLISIIDDADRYRNAVDSVNQRIFNALSDLACHPEIQPQWLEAALIAFSSTLYFPREMLSSSLRYLHMHVSQNLREFHRDDNDFHLFSNDPGALHEDYFRINELHGRLDQDKHARIKGVEDLGDAISDLIHTSRAQREGAEQQIRMIASRPIWVLLADQSLSGHSLTGDINKILWLFDQCKEYCPGPRRLLVLCQIITKTALAALRSVPRIKSAIRSNELIIESAIVLGDEYSVLSSESVQIKDKNLRKDLCELCEWFSREYLEMDKRLGRMRRKSGDNLEFGYRRAALLIARQENCPTDSLPILWHSGNARNGQPYRGPFPRVHSRIDEQKFENTVNLWEEIESSLDVSQALSLALSSQND